MKPFRKAMLIICGVSLIGILGVGGYVAYVYVAHMPLNFSSDKWKRGDAVMRGRMWKDLCESGILDGKTRQQVTDLLGEPDEKLTGVQDPLYDRTAPYAYTYRIRRYYTILYAEWPETCYLEFDENGCFTGTYVLD